MGAETVLRIVLLAVGSIACGVAIYALIETVLTMRSLRSSSEEIRTRVVPLLEKLDITVDAANAELLRIDSIVTQVEEVSERVSSATHTVHEVVNAPLEAVNAVSSNLREAWRERRRTRE